MAEIHLLSQKSHNAHKIKSFGDLNFIFFVAKCIFLMEEARRTTNVVRLDRNSCFCLDAPQIWYERVSTR